MAKKPEYMMPDFEGMSPVDAVARCLAQQDQGFISGSDWAGEVGREYRRIARRVLMTIRNYDNGVRSGGLPRT